MAPARAFWKGYLKLSLVSCPIAIYTGTSATERVSFRQINKKTGTLPQHAGLLARIREAAGKGRGALRRRTGLQHCTVGRDHRAPRCCWQAGAVLPIENTGTKNYVLNTARG
jgi:hypothetical protein